MLVAPFLAVKSVLSWPRYENVPHGEGALETPIFELSALLAIVVSGTYRNVFDPT